MLKFKIIIVTILVTLSTMSIAQPTNFNTNRTWQMNAKDIYFGVGASQFLGDLGGRDKVGANYSLADIDFGSTGFSVVAGYRLRFHKYFATTFNVNFALLRGDDKLTGNPYRHTRNLNFRSWTVSYDQRLEFILWSREEVGHRHRVPGLRGYKSKNYRFYLFSGAGFNYFYTQGKLDGTWHGLRAMNTEGQGLEGGPKKYLPITFQIPFGIGFRWGIGAAWTMGLEVSYIKTFSDYIDDVSTDYYDNNAIADAYGQLAADLADQNNGPNPNWTTSGETRGDTKQKDAYFMLNITFAKNLSYKSFGKSRFKRWKVVKAKF
jgi:hypothetical protein